MSIRSSVARFAAFAAFLTIAGVGIRAGALSGIFRAFQRADESRTDGLGLGLFIVKHAADLLKHRIEVRSAEGRGSCFTIVIDAGA